MKRIIEAAARHRFYLLVLAPALAALTVLTLLPSGLSLADTTTAAAGPSPSPATPGTPGAAAAPSDDGVAWSPGQGVLDPANQSKGNCSVDFDGAMNYGTMTGSAATTLYNALVGLPVQNVNQDGTMMYSMGQIGNPGTGSIPMSATATVDCSLTGGLTAFWKSQGSRVPGSGTAYLTALPRPDGGPALARPGSDDGPFLLPPADGHAYTAAWYTGALADLAATAAYIGVGVVTIATIVAFGAEIGGAAAAGLSSEVLASIAGCIGGAASTGILLAIAGGDKGPLSTIANTVTGCITGAALANIPIDTMGTWLGNQIKMALGGTVQQVTGSWLTGVAGQAAVDLSPVTTAVAEVAAGAIAALGWRRGPRTHGRNEQAVSSPRAIRHEERRPPLALATGNPHAAAARRTGYFSCTTCCSAAQDTARPVEGAKQEVQVAPDERLQEPCCCRLRCRKTEEARFQDRNRALTYGAP